MKFLVIGLGSMGKRRIRNLQFLGHRDIAAFELREDRRIEAEKEYGIKTYGDFAQAMETKPDAMVISAPPNYHVQYAKEAVKRGIHFFMEVTVDKSIGELAKLCREKKTVCASSSTLRFKQSVRKIKEILEGKKLGKVLAFNYHMGQYLPDWHPWESIKNFYVGKRETGACREMFCFETSWLTWLFGGIEKISCIKGKLSSLEVDIDDVYAIIYKFKNGAAGTFLLDVVSRVPYRELKILCEEGVISWNFDSVRIYTAKDKKWRGYKDGERAIQKSYWAKDDMYIEEIRHFIAAIKGREKYTYSVEDEKAIYDLLLSAEESSDGGKTFEVKEVNEL